MRLSLFRCFFISYLRSVEGLPVLLVQMTSCIHCLVMSPPPLKKQLSFLSARLLSGLILGDIRDLFSSLLETLTLLGRALFPCLFFPAEARFFF